ncbi:MAG: leucine-rich repeat domain-containing protein [Aureispira sp.]|nr:leucine-rich repeat domain-containing protein [Aureispira sp.]
MNVEKAIEGIYQLLYSKNKGNIELAKTLAQNHMATQELIDNLEGLSKELEKPLEELLVEELDLSYRIGRGNTKRTSLPNGIGLLKGLEKLNLEKNELSILPKSIGDLVYLEELDLYNNNLSELPQSIASLRNLRRLDFNNNQLKSVSSQLFELPNLVYCNLRGNQLKQLPEWDGRIRILNWKN